MTAPRVPQSTTLRAPRPDIDEDGKRLYIGVLERRCIMLGHENLRLRACLERATGQPWDSTNLADPTPEELDELVAGELARGLRMPMADARELVRNNKVLANPTQVETPQQ